MTDQTIYDAVRSKIHNGDVGAAVQEAIGSLGLDHYAGQAVECHRIALSEQTRPSVLYRPSLAPDGNMWCALYGENLQEGVAGFGETPAKAMADFDLNWENEKTRKGGV